MSAAPLPIARLLAITGLLLVAAPALADLRVCNLTGSRVGVAIGHRDAQGWVMEGWFNLKPHACENLLRGELRNRYYYVHAVDYDRGGVWGGLSFMCTRESEFVIRGFENCLARGYDRTGFFEIDMGERTSWTIQLTDDERAPGPTVPPGSTPARPEGGG